jgi:DNA-binding NarL/FixJ family response regulator
VSPRASAPHGTLLLVEPDNLVRSIVSSVVRELELARVRQAASLAMARHMLAEAPVDGLVLSLGEELHATVELLTQLRAGGFRSDAAIPVVAMAPAGDAALVARLKDLDVRRLLLQPFKLRDVVHTLEQLWPASEALAA